MRCSSEVAWILGRKPECGLLNIHGRRTSFRYPPLTPGGRYGQSSAWRQSGREFSSVTAYPANKRSQPNAAASPRSPAGAARDLATDTGAMFPIYRSRNYVKGRGRCSTCRRFCRPATTRTGSPAGCCTRSSSFRMEEPGSASLITAAWRYKTDYARVY